MTCLLLHLLLRDATVRRISNGLSEAILTF